MSTLREAAEQLQANQGHVEELLKTRLQLQQRKREVTASINQLDQKIIAIIGYEQDGSRTFDTGAYKVTTQGKMNRKIDAASWETIAEQIPEELRPVRIKYEVDLKKLRALEFANPELYRWICEQGALTTTPSEKPTLTIKEN